MWAVILAVGATPDFGVPFTGEVLPSAGVLIDAGTVGDRNDELNEILANAPRAPTDDGEK